MMSRDATELKGKLTERTANVSLRKGQSAPMYRPRRRTREFGVTESSRGGDNVG